MKVKCEESVEKDQYCKESCHARLPPCHSRVGVNPDFIDGFRVRHGMTKEINGMINKGIKKEFFNRL